jgi:hypothetical protein
VVILLSRFAIKSLTFTLTLVLLLFGLALAWCDSYHQGTAPPPQQQSFSSCQRLGKVTDKQKVAKMHIGCIDLKKERNTFTVALSVTSATHHKMTRNTLFTAVILGFETVSPDKSLFTDARYSGSLRFSLYLTRSLWVEFFAATVPNTTRRGWAT